MTDALDALFEDKSTLVPASTIPLTPEAPPAAQPETQVQPRDESGRFKPKAEGTQPEPKATEASPAAPVVQQPQQPADRALTQDDVKAIIEYRQKWQAEQERAAKFETEAKNLRERLEQQNAQPIPDINLDPEGYASHIRSESQRAALNSRFETSEIVAQQTHGEQLVKDAMDWGMAEANRSQAFASEYVQQRHPVDWIVKRFKRDQILTQLGDKDPVEWAKELLAAQQAQPAQAPQASASPQSAAPQVQQLPSPSLATARSAGGGQMSVPIHANAAFDAVFSK